MFKKFFKVKYLLLVIILFAAFLRFYKITVNPPSLFGDELDLGYQAYSILKTGRDYYGNFLPIHFHSLAEWRTPLYLYSAVPTVAIWGISPLGVRVPAALFGVLGVWAIFLFVKEFSKRDDLALISAAILAISPWHLQYSRAGFEATQMILFFLIGLWLFFKGISKNKGTWLWLSVVFLTFTPWIYSTAKLFTPLLLIFLFVTWRKEILSFKAKHLIYAVVAGLIVGIPIVISTIFGGGAARFDYLSVFTDPTAENQIGEARLLDAQARGVILPGTSPLFVDKLFNNKITFWGNTIIGNILQSFSTEFLFIKGDPNLRQSIGIGEFYKVDVIFLVLGSILFFTAYDKNKNKYFILFWILAGVIPAAITRDGGNHATRLILILIPLVLLISYGLTESYRKIRSNIRFLIPLIYSLILVVSFVFYDHEYWVPYPFNSERWWHYGFEQSFDYIKSVDKNYERIFLSMKGEPAYIFFAGWYEYPPANWQRGFPFKSIFVEGFGRISYIDKYYFGSPGDGASIYDLSKFISNKDLYLANATEVPPNLIMDPGSVPSGLKLLKSVAYPSGEPAYYIFTSNR